MNTSSPAFATLVTVVLVVAGVSLVISCLKGRFGLLFVGLLLTCLLGPQELYILSPVVPFVGACWLAKPRSFWARRFYDAAKMARARERFT